MRAPLLAGWGRAEYTPDLPFPLAGHVTRAERMAAWVRDPLAVTAALFRQGEKTVALVSIDLLIVDEPLHRAAAALASSMGIGGLYLNATHTHSALGGYVQGRGASLFMGRYRPEYAQRLLDALRDALVSARANEAEVTALSRGTAMVPGLTMNRRYRGGQTDDRVTAVLLDRKGPPRDELRGTAGARPILLFSASGHPVIASTMDPHAAGGDFPAVSSAALSGLGFLPLFVSGPQGGLNILYPEMATSLEGHLSLVAGLVVRGVESALVASTPAATADLGFGMEMLEFPVAFPPMVAPGLKDALVSAATAAVGHVYAHVTTAGRRARAPATVLRLGDVALAGMPADFGVTAALALRDRLSREFGLLSIVSSQTNGYAGYAHLPEEYRWTDNAAREFFFYENAMAWFGPDVAAQLNDAAVRVCAQILNVPVRA